MLTRHFERLFRRLLAAFIAYDDAPRTVDRVAELGAVRAELDHVRREIADERIVVQQRMQRAKALKRTAVSDDDIAALRVQGLIGA